MASLFAMALPILVAATAGTIDYDETDAPVPEGIKVAEQPEALINENTDVHDNARGGARKRGAPFYFKFEIIV